MQNFDLRFGLATSDLGLDLGLHVLLFETCITLELENIDIVTKDAVKKQN